jgi:Secretion system C-terminal sorting domain
MKSEIKLFTLLCLLFFLTITTQAQEVIATSGGDGTTSGANVNWTIGEIITETGESTNSILTQGFNQGDLLITKIIKEKLPGMSFNVYPNPASDHLKIVSKETDYENMRFILFDINGRPLIEKPLSGVETDIQIGNLRPSTYLLKVYQNNTEVTIFKIIKK